MKPVGGYAVLVRRRLTQPAVEPWIVKCVVGSHEEAKAILEGMPLELDTRIATLSLPVGLIITNVILNEVRIDEAGRKMLAYIESIERGDIKPGRDRPADRPAPEEWR